MSAGIGSIAMPFCLKIDEELLPPPVRIALDTRREMAQEAAARIIDDALWIVVDSHIGPEKCNRYIIDYISALFKHNDVLNSWCFFTNVQNEIRVNNQFNLVVWRRMQEIPMNIIYLPARSGLGQTKDH